MPEYMGKKAVIIGLDGATFDVIDPLIEKGELKTLKTLMQNGTRGLLRSTIPSYTALAIASFLTGTNPGKHGIFDFTVTNHYNYGTAPNLANASIIGVPTIWDVLSDNGKELISFLYPLSYPPRPINGVMVSKVRPQIAKRKPFTYPESVKNELMAHLGGLDYSRIPFSGEAKKRFNESSSNEFFARSLRNLNYKFEIEKKAVRFLMRRYDWDVLMVYFNNTDLIQHWFWKFMDKDHPLHDPLTTEYAEEVFNVYRVIDEFIGELLETITNETNLIIFSDHGFGPLYYKFYLNKWLQDKGLLVFKEGNRKKLKVSQLGINEIINRLGMDRLLDSLPSTFSRFRFPVPKITGPSLQEKVDWERTKAYGTLFGINVNLKGRDPLGSVELYEYDQLVDLIKKMLAELHYYGKGPVIDRVYQKEDLYSGKYLDHATDIVFTFKDLFPCQITIDLSEGDIFRETGKKDLLSGTHFSSNDGILIANGPDIKRNGMVNGATIFDLFPTICYLTGTPIPSLVDGKVLTEVIYDDYLKRNPIELIDTSTNMQQDKFSYTEEERRSIERELRALGYME